jgi:hypothetical protein
MKNKSVISAGDLQEPGFPVGMRVASPVAAVSLDRPRDIGRACRPKVRFN